MSSDYKSSYGNPPPAKPGETVVLPDYLRSAYELGRLAAPLIEADDGRKIALVPKDTQQITILPGEPLLTRVKQAVVLHDAVSFINYVERYKTDRTRLFAEPGFLAKDRQGVISAVIDYHGMDGGRALPEYTAHMAVYKPRYSDAWKRWMAASGQTFKQTEFAEFVEEVRTDIRDPSAASMLDIVRTFKASKKVDFDSLTYTNNGDVLLHYSEKTEEKGEAKMPEKLVVGIAVFFRGEMFAVPLFVRFKVVSGGVVFTLKADRADIIEDEAFNKLAADIGEKLQIVPYLGRLD